MLTNVDRLKPSTIYDEEADSKDAVASHIELLIDLLNFAAPNSSARTRSCTTWATGSSRC